MEKADLLQQFSAHLETYGRFRGFIDKAKAQTGKFSATVIEKVCLDNEVKSMEAAESIRPLVPQVVEVIEAVKARIAEMEKTKATADERMEELDLRHTIGELDDDEFERDKADIEKDLAGAEGKMAESNQELESFQSALDRWAELAGAAGHDTGMEPEGGPVIEDDAGTHAERVEMVEDMSAVFGGQVAPGAAAAQVRQESEEPISIETAEASEDLGMSVDVDLGFDEGEEQAGAFLAEAGGEVEIDLEPGNGVAADGAGEALAEGAVRRALLLYQEGTADEQIYPFHGEVLTVGRGRDNDIQIKNDSKVSRYHCKIYRKGDNFYIQDNKSSNGSLVNGELVTERRLFGGEEIIIGETFFRFRIMD